MGAEIGNSTQKLHARAADRGAGADHDQVRRPRQRSDQGVVRSLVSGSSAGPSTRPRRSSASRAGGPVEARAGPCSPDCDREGASQGDRGGPRARRCGWRWHGAPRRMRMSVEASDLEVGRDGVLHLPHAGLLAEGDQTASGSSCSGPTWRRGWRAGGAGAGGGARPTRGRAATGCWAGGGAFGPRAPRCRRSGRDNRHATLRSVLDHSQGASAGGKAAAASGAGSGAGADRGAGLYR